MLIRRRTLCLSTWDCCPPVKSCFFFSRSAKRESHLTWNMCWGLNSQWFPVVGDGHRRRLYAHYIPLEGLPFFRVGWPSWIWGVDDRPWLVWYCNLKSFKILQVSIDFDPCICPPWDPPQPPFPWDRQLCLWRCNAKAVGFGAVLGNDPCLTYQRRIWSSSTLTVAGYKGPIIKIPYWRWDDQTPVPIKDQLCLGNSGEISGMVSEFTWLLNSKRLKKSPPTVRFFWNLLKGGRGVLKGLKGGTGNPVGVLFLELEGRFGIAPPSESHNQVLAFKKSCRYGKQIKAKQLVKPQHFRKNVPKVVSFRKNWSSQLVSG